MRKHSAILTAIFLFPSLASAQITYSVTGGTVTENFDTLITSGTSQPWTNNSTLIGWHLFNQLSGGTAITTYNAGNGSSNTGSFYSFGTGTTTERALGGAASGGTYFGSPATGAVAGWIAVSILNNTGESLTSFTMNYDGEQWRNGGNASAQTMVVEYGFGSTFTGVGTWTVAGTGFNFTSPIVGTTAAALDGNAAANRVAGLGGTINNITWNNGDTLWFRFIENNDVGNDHGLGVDNFSFSATAAVPEPATYALIGLTGIIGTGVWFVRRRKMLAGCKS